MLFFSRAILSFSPSSATAAAAFTQAVVAASASAADSSLVVPAKQLYRELLKQIKQLPK